MSSTSTAATGGAGGAAAASATIDFKVGDTYKIVEASGDQYDYLEAIRDVTIKSIIPTFDIVVEIDRYGRKTDKTYTLEEFKKELVKKQRFNAEVERRRVAYEQPDAVAVRARKAAEQAERDAAYAAAAPVRAAAAAAREAQRIADQAEDAKFAAQQRVMNMYNREGTPFDLSVFPPTKTHDVSSMNMCYITGKKVVKIVRPNTYSVDVQFEDNSIFRGVKNALLFKCLPPDVVNAGTRGRRQRKTRKANSRRNRLRA